MPSEKIKELITTVFLTIVFALLATLPAAVLSVLCTAALAALLGYVTVRFHYGFVAFHAFLIFAVYALFQQNIFAALMAALPVVLSGLVLGIGYNLKLTAFRVLIVFTSVYVLNAAGSIKLLGLSAGRNILEDVIAAVGQVYKESLTAMYGSQLSSTEINSIVSELTSTLLRFSPSFIVISCIFFAVLCYYLFKRVLIIRKCDVTCFSPFSEWRADKFISITYFVLLAIYFVVPSNSFLSDVLLNMATVMTFVFFLLGLSFLEYKFKKTIQKSSMRKVLLVVVAFAAFALMGLPFLVISVIGALDGFIDFRNRKTQVR